MKCNAGEFEALHIKGKTQLHEYKSGDNYSVKWQKRIWRYCRPQFTYELSCWGEKKKKLEDNTRHVVGNRILSSLASLLYVVGLLTFSSWENAGKLEFILHCCYVLFCVMKTIFIFNKNNLYWIWGEKKITLVIII